MSRTFIPALASLALAGCAGAAATPDFVDVTKPPPETMTPPAVQRAIPACESDPGCRIRYYAESRKQCGDTADTLRGLQRYVSTITAAR